jgi:hypothetical protein
MALLIFVFDRVAQLGRPVALHGFFNSSDCVAVVDARSEDGDLSLPDLASDEWRESEAISLALGEDAVADAVALGRPRVWIIRTDSEHRDALATELNASFSRPHRQVPSPQVLGAALSNDEYAVELVGRIEADRVEIRRPSVAFSILNLPGQQDQFYAITGPEGAKLLWDHLEMLLKEQWDADEEWREFLRELPEH